VSACRPCLLCSTLLCSDSRTQLKLTFIQNNEKIAFRATLSELRGNLRTRTPSIAVGKPVVDFIFVNCIANKSGVVS